MIIITDRVVVEECYWGSHQAKEYSVVKINGGEDTHHEECGRTNYHGDE